MSTPHRLQELAISETGFVFDPYSGGTFTVNRTGLTILHGLREKLTRPALLERLRAQYQISANTDLETDLGEFTRLLIHQGLLPADFVLDDGRDGGAGAERSQTAPRGQIAQTGGAP
jgi:hypothetical protein